MNTINRIRTGGRGQNVQSERARAYAQQMLLQPMSRGSYRLRNAGP